jgi:hypothetical protein
MTTGRHVQFDKMPINNMWLSMLDRAGAPIEKFGDSTGKFNLL